MAILSTGTSGISNVSYRNLQKKETAIIFKHIDQLPQNLTRVYNLVVSFDRSHKNFKCFYSSCCFHCFLLFIYCPSFVPTLILHLRYKMFTNRTISCQTINLQPINSLLWVKAEVKNNICNRFYDISCEGSVFMERVLKKC